VCCWACVCVAGRTPVVAAVLYVLCLCVCACMCTGVFWCVCVCVAVRVRVSLGLGYTGVHTYMSNGSLYFLWPKEVQCRVSRYIYVHQCTQRFQMSRRSVYQSTVMGWLRLVVSFKLSLSFVEYRLFYRVLLQKRPIILRSLLIVAIPYADRYTGRPVDRYITLDTYMYTGIPTVYIYT